MTIRGRVRGVLGGASLLSPCLFCFRIESRPRANSPADRWTTTLATRLTIACGRPWETKTATTPCGAGKLHDPEILEQQTRRMMNTRRNPELATSSAAQWIHVGAISTSSRKERTVFSRLSITTSSRAIYEESVLLFQDLFSRTNLCRVAHRGDSPI